MSTNEKAVAPSGVAGVALTPPQSKYELADWPHGALTLQRKGEGDSLLRATLIIRLHPPEDNPAAPAREARFDFARMHVFVGNRSTDGARLWRSLIVDHGLLGRPELLWSTTRSSAPEGAPIEEEQALSAALAELRADFAFFTEYSAKAHPWMHLECDACVEDRYDRADALREQAQAQAALERGARGRRQARYLSPATAPPVVEQKCPHVPLLAKALRDLCKAFPELTFELIGWLTPANRKTRYLLSPEPPRRFVLADQVLEAILGHFLLGKALEEWHFGYAHRSYGGRMRGRRSYYRVDRKRGVAGEGAKLSTEQRSALTFSATGWQISTPVEGLIAEFVPSTATGQEREGEAVPALDPRARPPIEAPFLLPERHFEAAQAVEVAGQGKRGPKAGTGRKKRDGPP